MLMPYAFNARQLQASELEIWWAVPAWEMVKQALIDYGDQNQIHIPADDIQLIQETLAIHEWHLKPW